MLAKMLHHHDPSFENAYDQQPNTKLIHGPNDEAEADDDEREETLSFCEFSIHSDADSSGDSYKESSSNNSSFKYSEEEDDMFEFFSQEHWKASSPAFSSSRHTTPPPENIIFCGKLIPYKEPTSESSQKLDNIGLRKSKRMNKTRVLRWKKWNLSYPSHNKSNTPRTKYSQKKPAPESEAAKQDSLRLVPERSRQGKNRNKEHDLSVHKMPSRSRRWYLAFFGTRRFGTRMELKDMRWRQSRSRRSSSSSFHHDSNNTNTSFCIKKWNVFWALLRVLSCTVPMSS